MKLCIVFCRNRQRFNKWVKKIGISNKLIIDTRKFIDDEGIDVSQVNYEYHKVLIWKKMEYAFSKGKDVYYIPWIDNPDFSADLPASMKALTPPLCKFEMLAFHEDLETEIIQDLFSTIHIYDASQIIEG
jgi:hypothetical protein